MNRIRPPDRWGGWARAGVTHGAVLAGARVVGLTVEVGATAILMRKLGPAPFGLVAMATSLVVAFGVLADAGVGTSLVSDRRFDEHRVAAATVLSAAVGVLMGLVALAATPLVVGFYGDPRIAVVWQLSCVLLAVTTLASVPTAIAQRHEQFWVMGWTPVVASTLAAASALMLAQVRTDFWPILLRQAVTAIVAVIAMWCLVRPRMRRPRRADFAEVYRFSRGLVGFNFLNILNRHADNVIVGRALGEQALGFYMLAYNFLMLPLTQIGGIIRGVAYPRLSRMAPRWQEVGEGLAALMRYVAMFATPLFLGMALAAPEIVLVIFGQVWTPSILPLRVLALLAIYQAPFALSGLAYIVTRKTDVMARWGAIATPVILMSFFVGLPWGITGVAIAYALASLALAWPLTRVVASVLEVPPALFARAALWGGATGLVGAIPVLLVYACAKALGFSAAAVLGVSVMAGLLGEVLLLVGVMRCWWSAGRGLEKFLASVIQRSPSPSPLPEGKGPG